MDGGSTWTGLQTLPSSGTGIYEFTKLESGIYNIVARVYNNAYNNTPNNLKNVNQGITTSQIIPTTVVACPVPTYEVLDYNKITQAKIVRVNYGKVAGCTGYYSLDRGSTWITTTNDIQDVIVTENNTFVIARNIGGGLTKTTSAQQVTNIDTSAPTNVAFTTERTNNQIKITASASDAQSGIYGYQFSTNNGSTWSNIQTSNVYTFTANKDTSYIVQVRAINNAYQNTTSNLRNTSQGITSTSASVCNLPTFIVNPRGWTQAAIVTINSPSGYTTTYSTDGNTFVNGNSVTLGNNGYVIAKTTNGSSTCTITQTIDKIDTSAPTNVAFTTNRTSDKITITASALDAQSGIYGYQFSINNGSTWSNIQTSNTYSVSTTEAGSYIVKVRAINNAYNNTESNLRNVSQGITESGGVTPCVLPTFTVSPRGWTQAAIVTINSPSGYTTTYSTNGGSTFASGNSVTVTSNNTNVIAKTTNGTNTCTVTQVINNIDTSAPTNVAFTTERTNNQIKVTASASDAQSGIYGYQFSINNGSTWSNIQTSNVYTFTANKNTNYTIQVRAINNAYNNTASNLRNASQGITSTSGNVCNLPTFTVSPTGSTWAQSKVVTINSQSGYTTTYSTNGGSTFTNGNSVTLIGNGNVIAKTTNGSSTCTVTQAVNNIDRTPPTSVTINTSVNGRNISVTASASDPESSISRYAFSSNGGQSYTAWQTGNTYTFSNLNVGTYNIVVKAWNGTFGTTGASESIGAKTSAVSQAAVTASITGTPSLTVNWPNTSQIGVSVSNVTATGDTVSYRYYINNVLKQDWTTSNRYVFTGLAQGTAYTIKVETKTTNTGINGASKTATIYTSKNVSGSSSYASNSSCTSGSYTVAADSIYNGTTLYSPSCSSSQNLVYSGTCSTTYDTTGSCPSSVNCTTNGYTGSVSYRSNNPTTSYSNWTVSGSQSGLSSCYPSASSSYGTSYSACTTNTNTTYTKTSYSRSIQYKQVSCSRSSTKMYTCVTPIYTKTTYTRSCGYQWVDNSSSYGCSLCLNDSNHQGNNNVVGSCYNACHTRKYVCGSYSSSQQTGLTSCSPSGSYGNGTSYSTCSQSGTKQSRAASCPSGSTSYDAGYEYGNWTQNSAGMVSSCSGTSGTGCSSCPNSGTSCTVCSSGSYTSWSQSGSQSGLSSCYPSGSSSSGTSYSTCTPNTTTTYTKTNYTRTATTTNHCNYSGTINSYATVYNGSFSGVVTPKQTVY